MRSDPARPAWPAPDPVLRRVAAGFTVWMVLWAGVILWAHGPQNFFWLCNIAQFIVLYSLWTGHRLLLSSQAGTVVFVGLFWTPDFLLGAVSGGAWANFTGYMFTPDIPLLARGASLYHIFMPVLVIWAVQRLGYDRRGPWLQTVLALAVLPATRLFTEPERNINWLTAPLGIEQVWMPDTAFVAVMMLLYPLLLFWPGHGLVLLIRRMLARGGPRPAQG